MILSVKVYFKVEESLKPEEVQETVRLLQERTTELLKNRYSIKGGPKIQGRAFRLLAQVLTWTEVQKELNVRIPEETDSSKNSKVEGLVSKKKPLTSKTK